MNDSDASINLPVIDIEDVKKQFEGINSGELKAMRDGLRVADSAMSLVLWDRQGKGEKVFENTEYEAPERLEHYTERGNKYLGRTVSHGVEAVLDLLGKFLPGKVIDIIKIILKIVS